MDVASSAFGLYNANESKQTESKQIAAGYQIRIHGLLWVAGIIRLAKGGTGHG